MPPCWTHLFVWLTVHGLQIRVHVQGAAGSGRGRHRRDQVGGVGAATRQQSHLVVVLSCGQTGVRGCRMRTIRSVWREKKVRGRERRWWMRAREARKCLRQLRMERKKRNEVGRREKRGRKNMSWWVRVDRESTCAALEKLPSFTLDDNQLSTNSNERISNTITLRENSCTGSSTWSGESHWGLNSLHVYQRYLLLLIS